MGGSDAYLSGAEMAQDHNLLNIPLAVSAVMISYNLPGHGPSEVQRHGSVQDLRREDHEVERPGDQGP